jgi:hypothetical protein
MKDFELEYDAKTHAFSVNHTNILKDAAKEYADTLIIKAFQISVQVTVDKDVRVANPDAVDTEMQTLADELETQILQEIGELDDKIRKLKKEEDAGNTGASAEADKIVKLSKKKLEKLASEFGMNVRVAIEKELTRQNRGGKVKGRSASRTILRDLDLNDDFFEQKSKSEQSDPYFGKLAQSLAASGKEISKLTLEEKSLRRSLGDDILRVQKLVEAKKTGGKIDIRQFAKDNSKDARGLESAAQKYIDFVTGLKDKLAAASKTMDNFNKLVDHAENLDDQKEIEKQIGVYEKALTTIEGTIDEKLSAGKAALRLFKDDYETGAAWTTLEGTLDGIPAAAKSGGFLQDSGAVLAKLSKK